MTKTILVLSAHNDDQIIGAGGTLAKYAAQGFAIKTVVFSYGESSHPHLKPEVIKSLRMKECETANKIISGDDITYFDLKEIKFAEGIKKFKIKEQLKKIIRKEKPVKVFTHSINDPHPDHKIIANLTIELLDVIPCPVYTFEIWTPLRLRQRYFPKLFEDISKTFETKMRALGAHKSQKITMINLATSVFLKAKIHGFAHGCSYAEVFDKIK